jgi:hypothetical protein
MSSEHECLVCEVKPTASTWPTKEVHLELWNVSLDEMIQTKDIPKSFTPSILEEVLKLYTSNLEEERIWQHKLDLLFPQRLKEVCILHNSVCKCFRCHEKSQRLYEELVDLYR